MRRGVSESSVKVERSGTYWACVGVAVAACPFGAAVGSALPVDESEFECVCEECAEGDVSWFVAGAEEPGLFDEVGE